MTPSSGPRPTICNPAEDLAAAALALARRFAAGATLWCAAPRWPAHASHVAVEFVHPVIVGKRALPAVAVTDADLAGRLRVLARAGDVFVALADADDGDVADTMRRCRAWGVETLWFGAGPRPPAGAADHVLWLDDDPSAWWSGSLVLGYHLLWELTHVCFEHPGLLEASPDCDGEVCVTCADEGRLGEVVAASGDGAEATVRTPQGREQVDVLLVGPRRPGDLVVIHAGSAITVLEGGGRA